MKVLLRSLLFTLLLLLVVPLGLQAQGGMGPGPGTVHTTGGGGGVTFDATASTSGDGGSFSYSHTCTGSNLYLVVGISFLNSAGRSVSGVTYNSVAMSSLGTATNGIYSVQLWGLANPATGAHNVVVTMGGPPNSTSIGSVSFTGVNASTPTSGFASATGSSANPAVTVTSTTSSMVLAATIDAGSTSLTVNKTLRWNAILGTDTPRGGGATAAGASSVTTTFTGSNNSWATAGISIDP